ncbi:MAG: RNA-binding cell elongation regulator Jag/EloR [Acidimicrobiales bacterium]|nr:RNA-binding cell elongation regulator Jag/EloR [Acidimicrobiales bacterium]
MQWVVTTGRSVAAAKERALDALGIPEDDLEYEVVAEATTSLFGLRTTEARVRARVRPTRPRPKIDRRNRRSKRDGRKRKTRTGGTGGDAQKAASGPSGGGRGRGSGGDRRGAAPTEKPTSPAPKAEPAATTESSKTRTGGPKGATMSDIPLTEQEPTAVDFVRGLVDAFGAEATITAEHLDEDEAIEIRVEGEDLGLLVGQRGNTLSSIAELTRTAVAQEHSGRLEGRLRVDVAGYRARRKEALVRFVHQVADKVLDTGDAVALEPMSPPDRKIVHDAVNELDGVHTSSRGEDRRRHVVVHPDD